MSTFEHAGRRIASTSIMAAMPASGVTAQTVKDFFQKEGFQVFAVSQGATGRWQVNLRGKSPLAAFNAANRFSAKHNGHKVQVLVG